MRVGLNGRYLQKTLTGIEYYLFNLIKTLPRADSSNDYYLFVNSGPFVSEDVERFLATGAVRTCRSRWPSGSRISRLAWDYLALQPEVKREKIDIFHGPSFSIPLVNSCPSVVTIHDLAWRYFPDTYTWINRYYLDILLPPVIKKADLIITDSVSSKRDIVNILAVPQDKVVVVYPGVSRNFKVITDPSRLRRVRLKHGISRNFILNVSGLITSRKNLVSLLESFAELRRRKIIDHQLVIVGKPAWSYSKTFEAVARLNLKEDVIFTGSVSNEDLVALYNAADVFVFPSWYEGFGFPVLEAMSCGTPTVTSNVSSLPELVGDAGALIDPASKEDLSRSIKDVLEDKILREDMISKGLSRVKSFTWENTASETLKVYKRVAA